MRSATSLSPDMRDEYLRGIFSPTFDHQISEMDRTFDSLMLRLGKFFCFLKIYNLFKLEKYFGLTRGGR